MINSDQHNALMREVRPDAAQIVHNLHICHLFKLVHLLNIGLQVSENILIKITTHNILLDQLLLN